MKNWDLTIIIIPFQPESKRLMNAFTAVNMIQSTTHLLIANVKSYVKNVIKWFNAVNNSNFTPTIEEKLFGIMSSPYDKILLKKLNYTTLFMRFYIHTFSGGPDQQ